MSDAEVVVGSRTERQRGAGYVTRIEEGTWLLIAGGHAERIVATAPRRLLCVVCDADVTVERRCLCLDADVMTQVRDVAPVELAEKARRRHLLHPILVRVSEVITLEGWTPGAAQ